MSKLRFEQFKNNKTEFKQLKELVDYLQPNKYLVENDNYSDQFSTPVLTPNKSFLLGYTSQNNTFDRECVIIDDFTLDVKYVNFPFMLKSGAVKILISDKMDIYYLYYLLLTYPFIINGHSRHYISYVQELEFKIPSIEEQKKIGCFFKEIDELIELYKNKLDKILNVKKYILQGLNSNNDHIYLKDICEITTGKLNANAMVANGKYNFYTCSKNILKIDKYEFDTEALLISGNGEHVGYIHYFKGKFNAYQRTYVLTNFSLSIKYIYYFLYYILPIIINKEKNNSNTPYITLSTLENIKIPLPNDKTEYFINILVDLDEEINYIDKMIELYNKYKKYYLNKIFC